MTHSARTRIKICGLTRASDVDAAVQAGVDALGFVLYSKSARHVPIERAAELARRLPPFVTPVLLFVNESPQAVIDQCAKVPGCMIQFHGDESPEQCWQSSGYGRIPFLRAARIPIGAGARAFDLLKYVHDFSSAKAILLDADVEGFGGSGQTFEWSQLPPNVDAHLVLSGGLNAANVTDGIRQVRPRCRSLAVDVSSGVEVAQQKGIKDPVRIAEFVKAVHAADF